jgi:NAD(P)-dependent dehydrogenase (short-subunit alcohol dehydrogenase family)
MSQLSGKVALITGAGSGIGKGAALLLAQEGARIAALDTDAEELQKVVQTIQQQGGEAIALAADVSQREAVRNAIEQTIAQWDQLDVVFANAGINGKWAPLEELELEDWNKTLNINLTGTFLTIKYATPYLKRQGGSVIITSSVQGTRMFSNAGASAYATSKAGQVAFTKMVALELAKFHIRVNVICPGAIETNIDQNTQKSEHLVEVQVPVEFPEGSIPLTHGKPGTIEDVAQLVLFLASERSSLISGTEIWIDGTGSLLVG